jgi:peptide chain release factor 1
MNQAPSFLTKLEDIERKYEDLSRQLSSPETISQRELFQRISREHKELTELVSTYRAYKKVVEESVGAEELTQSNADAEMKMLAEEELSLLRKETELLEEKLRILLIPKDPNDEKNSILEIRAGAGGDEAGIFAGDIFRLYTRYAESQGWKIDIMSMSEATNGGYKEIIATIKGTGVFAKLKYERGVHRVQRVPVTESQGRIHTSTITVAVLPEVEDVEIEILEKDLRIDVYRSSGPGGQSVNTTDSAVRITHLPSGVVVAMQDEKSQHKNREKAMKVLRARIYEQKQREADAERQADRRSQVGSGERSEKVRTYNYPQSRITDHRIGLTIHSLDQVMNGDLDQIVDPLISHFQAEALKGESLSH